MPKLNTYCLPDTYVHTQETRMSNNISSTFQHFLLREELLSGTTDFIFHLLEEEMKENSCCMNHCCTRPHSQAWVNRRPGWPVKGVSCPLQKGLKEHWRSGICQELSAWPPPLHSPYPQIKSTKDMKNKAKEASVLGLMFGNMRPREQRQIYLRKYITTEDIQYLLEKEFFTTLEFFC